ncbi:phosphatidylinositol N-acetylglucosaminyltransferase subunit gpi1 [Tulasnella sp. 403]|nr:phosphatidylinositol N-acetylglucosaminyltransferase subunit gpi1 [Tulasnella sp. 403]
MGSPCLKDISTTFHQIDTRTEQATVLPSQLDVIQLRSRQNIAYSTAQYINFYNCIWLILNDTIVGTTVGIFFMENAHRLANVLSPQIKGYTVDSIQEALLWLDNWPVGLKLNTELSRFLCLLFRGLTDVWARTLLMVIPFFPHLIIFLGMSGRFGLTVMLSLISDALSLLTIHLYLGYIIATTLFSQLTSVAGSLWRVFRGKRRNVLRNRTDSWDYDLDQLLLGTILFTLITFLFPTILVYYTLFAFTRVIIIGIHATLETCMAFMNHFPLFAMMLRLKDPRRLPGGVYFDTANASKGSLELKNQPISYGRIFFQHVRIWSKLSAHYDPRRLLKCLVTGTIITPIQRYKIVYNVIPRHSPNSLHIPKEKRD